MRQDEAQRGLRGPAPDCDYHPSAPGKQLQRYHRKPVGTRAAGLKHSLTKLFALLRDEFRLFYLIHQKFTSFNAAVQFHVGQLTVLG